MEYLPGTGHLRGANAPACDTEDLRTWFPENSGTMVGVAGRSPFDSLGGRSATHVQFLKSATPSQTNWTAMARIRKPKILLMAPTALGPSRRTNGPPSQKKSNTVSATAAMPMTMPMYDAVLSTLAASPMTTPMAPGPDISGIASGVREISSLSCASLLSSGVMRACEVTMPQAVLATINPPAIFRTGSEMPKKYSTKRPKNRNVTRITNTQRPVFSAV